MHFKKRIELAATRELMSAGKKKITWYVKIMMMICVWRVRAYIRMFLFKPYAIFLSSFACHFKSSCYVAICSIDLPLKTLTECGLKISFLIYGLFIHLICTENEVYSLIISIWALAFSTHNFDKPYNFHQDYWLWHAFAIRISADFFD